MWIRLSALLLLVTLGCASGPPVTSSGPPVETELHVLAWNIWHGGREDGEELGPAKVVDVIRSSGADVVAMQETYGSGERIAEALGFEFHPRGTNVSILSRYPVLEDLSVHAAFNCVGALLELPGGTRAAVYSIWLPYDAEIWAPGTRDVTDREVMLAACRSSARELTAIRDAIEARLTANEYADVPIVVAGDFNAMSHLDYGEVAIDRYGVTLDWPTSRVLADVGFRDAYRERHPRIDRAADATWTPRFPDQEQDRIDFVLYRSPEGSATRWRATQAAVLRELPDGFPSDHAAVLATLRAEAAQPTGPRPLRAATYNIHRAEGTDGVLDVDRIARVLRELGADVVGLQEVDIGTERSERANQALELAGLLGMHPAFGGFMDYQGGRYGMAILSRFPIASVRSFELPEGNEPRVALLVDVRLPDDSLLLVANVHFDWVDDDRYRFAQATALADHLRTIERPYVLLGDFNDVPGSRTLELFDGFLRAAEKPGEDRSTWPSMQPEVEIDHVLCAPPTAWGVGDVRVVDEPLASDHRPVVVDLLLR